MYNKVLILERNLSFMFIDIAKYMTKFGVSSKLTILPKIFHKILKEFIAHLIIRFAKKIFCFSSKIICH